MFDVHYPLVEDSGAFGVKAKPSNITNGSFGCGLFSSRPFEAGEVVGCYYGPLVYSDLMTQMLV